MIKNDLKGLEAILFDFEGTLVDFQWRLTEALQETLTMLRGLGLQTDRFQSRKYSTLMREAMERAPDVGQSPEEVRKKISAIYDRYDEDALTRWSLRPKARDFLSVLKIEGVKTGLVSNVGRRALEGAIKKLGLSSLFDVVLSRNDVQHLKPNGDGIRLALNRLEVPEEKALFVGDSIDDIQAAKEAGIRVVIILGGENLRPDLLSGGPDLLIQNFDELITCLKEEYS